MTKKIPLISQGVKNQFKHILEQIKSGLFERVEKPGIGVLLCQKRNDEVVKYALNRSISPTVIADYETKLIPKKLLRNKLNQICSLLEDER